MDATKAMPRKSEYLAAEDLDGGEFVVEITDAALVAPPKHWKKQDKAIVCTLKGAERKLWLNQTNKKAIMSHFGKFTEDWIGKSITLYVDKARDPNGGAEQVDCIRVVAKGSKRDRMSKMKARQQEGQKP